MSNNTKMLVMTFEQEGGKRVNLRLPNPKEDLTSAEVKSYMDMLVDTNLLLPIQGGATAKVIGAKVVETITDKLEVIDAN